jgi:hypothetical protein
LNISFLSIDHCGPTSTQGGDSTLISKNNYFSILYYNSTWNYGVLGASSFSSHYATPSSFVKFSQAIEGNDYDVFESISQQYFINFPNIINSSSSSSSIFWTSSNNMLVLDSCIFINPHIKFDTYDRIIISINCFSDTDIPLAYTKTNFLTINNFYITFLNHFCLFSHKYIKSCFRNNISYFHHILFSSILIFI